DVALLHLGVRARLLDRHDDDVAERRVLPARAAEHLDAQHPPRAGVVGDVQHGFRLHHGSARLLNDAAHPPTLVLAERSGLGDQNAIADAAAVLLIVRFVFGAALHVLLVLRMLDHALDHDHDGLVHLVADHDAFSHFHSAAHRPFLFAPGRARPLGLDGLDARDVAPRLDHRRRAIQLIGAAPQAEAEQRLAQLALLHLELLIAEIAQLFSLHGPLLRRCAARPGWGSTACATPTAWLRAPPRRSPLPSRR